MVMKFKGAFGDDGLSDQVKARLAAPLDSVPDIDPTPAEMDELLVELKSAGRVLRAKLREMPPAAGREEVTTHRHVEKPRRASSPHTDPTFASLLLRWAREYRAAQESWSWLIPAAHSRRRWKQRADRHSFVPLHDVLHTSSASSRKRSQQRISHLSFQFGSGKTHATLNLIEHLVLNQGTRVLERRHAIENFARLDDEVHFPFCTADIPLCSCSRREPDDGLLVIFIDSHAPFEPAARRDESASDARKRSRVDALRRRQERVPAQEAPPAPSLVLIVEACHPAARPERAASNTGMGLYVPLPRELRPAIQHLEEVQTWWRATLDDYLSDTHRGSVI
ncbi:hypothetical protein ACGFZU_34700 [Streptomyces tendae]|uniref:hypothetical protein n=1 Tax=Streptomyces tendae TaxID=1932 RepID=UPI003716523F